MSDYQTVLTASALRSLRSVPPRVAEPLVAFIFGSLAGEPRRRGKPLQRELEGRWAARRGDYRIVYRLDEDTKIMYVLKIGHRADVYRTR
ncbi:MAG: type II toxin-antitoxin system RelE/ParE family toxin [Actinomycetota bacterium]|nr:type II toxin-antitoxin system RelE/ParE family toxin [Actinomycetota bacterium]